MSTSVRTVENDLARVARGEPGAVDTLFANCRARLRQMVAVRLDRRLAARVDVSDVVQDTFLEAFRRLPEYLQNPQIPFFVWLRQLAWQRIAQLYRSEVLAQRRSVRRESPAHLPLSEESALVFADRLGAKGHSSSDWLRQEEIRDQVQQALMQLKPDDREVLVLRHLEQLSTQEIAAILQISEPAVRYRQRRALERLAGVLRKQSEDDG